MNSRSIDLVFLICSAVTYMFIKTSNAPTSSSSPVRGDPLLARVSIYALCWRNLHNFVASY